MSYAVESPSPTEATVKIQVPSQVVQDAIESELRKLAGQVKIPGFRPGKIPRKVLEKRFASKVEPEVSQQLIEEQFREALKTHHLHPVEPPQLEEKQLALQEDGGLEVEFKVEVIPDFDLPDYKGLSIPAPPVELKDEDVEGELERVRQEAAQVQDVSPGPAGPGDVVLADLQYQFLDGGSLPLLEDRIIDTQHGRVDDTPCEAAVGAFVGHSVGETIKVTLEIPQDSPLEEHRGKTAVVQCRIKSIRQLQLPDWDSEEFLQHFNVENRDQLRERVEKNLKAQLLSRRDRMVETACCDQLLEGTIFPVPEKYLEKVTDQERQKHRKSLTEQGLENAEIEKQLLEVDGRLSEQVERRFRESILLDRIGDVEQISVEEEELQMHFQFLSQALQTPAQQLFDTYMESGALPQLMDSLRRDKVRRFLRTSAATSDDQNQSEVESTEAAEESS